MELLSALTGYRLRAPGTGVIAVLDRVSLGRTDRGD
jgi:hypothetical protein